MKQHVSNYWQLVLYYSKIIDNKPLRNIKGAVISINLIKQNDCELYMEGVKIKYMYLFLYYCNCHNLHYYNITLFFHFLFIYKKNSMQIFKFLFECKQDRLIVVFRQMSNAKYNLEEVHNKMIRPFVFLTLVYNTTYKMV